MVYNPNIPQPEDRPSDSQSQLKENFSKLNSIFNIDHVPFNATQAAGEHDKITFNTVLGSDPAVVADESPRSYLYTKEDDDKSSQLFFENFDVPNAVHLVQQLTNLPIESGAKFGGTQYTWLSPWNMRFTMGITGSFTGSITDGYITNFGSIIYVALASPTIVGNRSFSITPKVDELTIQGGTGETLNAYYFVIGI